MLKIAFVCLFFLLQTFAEASANREECRIKRVLVTGGAGFLGSHLCERLLKDGHVVFCLDDLSTGLMQNISSFRVTLNFNLFSMILRSLLSLILL
jgi:UDP-glucuronate decarboxylase